MPDWQTMESAPRDGTKVILFEPLPDADRPTDGVWTGSHYGDHRGWGYGWKPTHWMPLPEPPATTPDLLRVVERDAPTPVEA